MKRPPIIIEPHHALGTVVWHATGYGPGVVIAYRVGPDDCIDYEIRWGGDELCEAVHDLLELTTIKPVELT